MRIDKTMGVLASARGEVEKLALDGTSNNLDRTKVRSLWAMAATAVKRIDSSEYARVIAQSGNSRNVFIKAYLPPPSAYSPLLVEPSPDTLKRVQVEISNHAYLAKEIIFYLEEYIKAEKIKDAVERPALEAKKDICREQIEREEVLSDIEKQRKKMIEKIEHALFIHVYEMETAMTKRFLSRYHQELPPIENVDDERPENELRLSEVIKKCRLDLDKLNFPVL